MPTKTITALITCFLLVLSSQSVLAQSSDKSEKEESSSSQTKSDDKDKDKDDEKAKKEAQQRKDQVDQDSKKTILYRIGAAGGGEKGNLSDTLSQGADKSSMDEAFKSAEGIEVQNQSEKSGDLAAGRPVVTGALDKAEIQKVIENHRNQIKFCYEKRLVEKPELAGLVKVKFVIAATGKVISSMVTESELGDREVESCLTKAIRTWTFPEPKSGGIVMVNYPFNFSTSE